MMSHPQIIYEDDVLLVCNKTAGLMVEPDRNNFPNLLQQVKQYLKETPMTNCLMYNTFIAWIDQ